MSAGRTGGRRRAGPVVHENEERWLLTYADMITLLMALFMVLFSISSVNVSKYRTLQESLKAAFSGSILPGGRSILQTGSESTSQHSPTKAEVPSIVPLDSTKSTAQTLPQNEIRKMLQTAAAAQSEQADFVQLRQRLATFAQAHGLAGQVQAVIERRGLVVRVLTDKLLFDSGQAALQPAGLPVLDEVAQLLNVDRSHPITVEGHTDNVPISSSVYPTNWELSTARASTVVRYLIGRGVDQGRLGAAGYAYLHPIASNASGAGRAMNRRVEIVFERLNPYSTTP